MKIYFDENFPYQIARALTILEEPSQEVVTVMNVSEEFGRGAPDEDWIPKVGKENGIIITQDLNIHHTRQQRELYRKHNLGVVFLKPPSKSGYLYWQMVNKILLSWAAIKNLAMKKERPFAFVLRSRSSKLEEL